MSAVSSSQQQAATQQKQPQGQFLMPYSNLRNMSKTDKYTGDLQTQYSNYKNILQQIAQKIGDIEQEAEEHKFVTPLPLLERI